MCYMGMEAGVVLVFFFMWCFDLCLSLPLRAQAPNKDTQLLAGTALSMLVNTAPQPQSGASAALALFQLTDQGVCSSLSWEPPHQGGSRDRRAGQEGMEGTMPLTGSQSQTAAVSPSCGAGAPCATVTLG